MMKRLNFLTLPLAVALLVGFGVTACAPSDEDAAGAETPVVTMAGKPEPKLTGTWVTANGQSTYRMKDDGSFHLKSKITNAGGVINSESDGQWSANEDKLYFKGASGFVAEYGFKLDGAKLTMVSTGSAKNETVLNKQ